MKTCIHCKRELPETAFSKSKSSQDGLQGYCKECSAQYRKAKREQDRKRVEELKGKIFKKKSNNIKEIIELKVGSEIIIGDAKIKIYFDETKNAIVINSDMYKTIEK